LKTVVLETFVEYPPSQAPASFSVDQVAEQVKRKIEQLKQQVAPKE
jgi:hypothetical protein